MKLKSLLIICILLTVFPVVAQVVGPTDDEIVANRDKAINLVNTRRKLDQLVWAPEVLAQQYETRIVQLWDELLQAEDKFNVLAAFPFNSLRLAKHNKSEPLQLRIARYSFSGEGTIWSHGNWQKFIASMAADGYKLEQSEWHHSSFQPPQQEFGARSEVSFELHITRVKPGASHHR